ncbi:serine/threonine-protein kinase [Neorhizobium sp. T25_13]|uniref:serine/threonine-protein kinase n=1 Tax=Neorhizobium sp. T25_13 TaxID=2093830 RepID=UPI00155E67FD|nr:serine/threonine-protein kinase [Neorhizobium sp. T25_13]
MSEDHRPQSTALVLIEDRPPIDPSRLLRGRYQLVAEIGRGGLSRVFKARDMVALRAGLADPHVALKLIAAGKNTDPDVIALMHREARRLRDLVHPNIVRVYDMDSDRRLHFMIMEYLEGQSLSRMLREAPGHRLVLPAVDRLVGKIAAALEFAHGKGIIHADLKPGNIFLETSGRIKLIDFNIAYPVARPRKTREEDTVAILGRLGALTPAYASPQRLAGAEPGTGDDVFSLGIITYLALTGIRPYAPGNALEAAEAGHVPTRPYGLSASRWRALRRAISLDDGERTASAAEFARDFTGGPFEAISGWWTHIALARAGE